MDAHVLSLSRMVVIEIDLEACPVEKQIFIKRELLSAHAAIAAISVAAQLTMGSVCGQ